MALAVVVLLVLVGVLVVALATYLAVIAYVLNKVSFTLGTILIGVRSIAHQTEPVGDVVGAIAVDVTAIDNALTGTVTAALAKAKATAPVRR